MFKLIVVTGITRIGLIDGLPGSIDPGHVYIPTKSSKQIRSVSVSTKQI